MARTADPSNPPCPRCGNAQTVRKEHTEKRQRWVCAGCRRSFGATTSTPLFRLKTQVTEVAQALLVVLRRGSLLAAEDVTGHKYETIGRWRRQAAAPAEALTAALVHDLHLGAVEVDAFWSFVWQTGAEAKRPAPPTWASGGAA